VTRSLAEKGWVPRRYWWSWWALLAVGAPLFYIVLAPIWIGIRAAAWVAELRARARARAA
jgi:hypothetical protein